MFSCRQSRQFRPYGLVNYRLCIRRHFVLSQLAFNAKYDYIDILSVRPRLPAYDAMGVILRRGDFNLRRMGENIARKSNVDYQVRRDRKVTHNLKRQLVRRLH